MLTGERSTKKVKEDRLLSHRRHGVLRNVSILFLLMVVYCGSARSLLQPSSNRKSLRRLQCRGASTNLLPHQTKHPQRSLLTGSGDCLTTMQMTAIQGGQNPDNGSSSNSSSSDKKDRFDSALARRISVGAILLSAFLNLLGFTMAGPITPALGKHFALPVASASFGSLTSAYPMGMLLGLFLWAPLSDRIGRKPVIVTTLLGSGLGLLAQSLVIYNKIGGLSTFLATRVLTGCFAGSSPVSKAYLADVGIKEGRLPKYLALRDAASTMAFIVGPLIGGVMFDLRRSINSTESLAFVITISSIASLIAGLVVAFAVRSDSPNNQQQNTNAQDIKQNNVFNEIKEEEALVSCPLGKSLWTGVATVCLVSFLFNVGDSTFHAFFSALLRDGIGMDTQRIGLSYTIFACISFVVSTTLTSPCLSKLGPVVTCIIGLTAVGSGLMAMSFSSAPVLLAAAIYYCGVPLYGPTIPTMLLRCVPSYRRGAVMGIDGAINTVARIISPLIMGDVFRRFGQAAAFRVASCMVFLSAVAALTRRIFVLRDDKNATSMSSIKNNLKKA